jgi:hypothetical protein
VHRHLAGAGLGVLDLVAVCLGSCGSLWGIVRVHVVWRDLVCVCVGVYGVCA